MNVLSSKKMRDSFSASKIKKKKAYDHIWEDSQKLSGKSYFPEFVDVDENQIEQWNHRTPPLKILESPRMDGEAQELCL
ncbi:hypothetical protein C5167_040763 [Papaver somniferum]|uniref:DM2 domain-containing protein n=1 Tax=Papaver somniferum TaxID=3469 RepID=A0A4Y7IK30_PAPSO|nr:hypothetical protein C5167_040763 [Papaver somniferum]